MQQNILESRPDAKVSVHAIWLPVLPSDARSEWDESLLADERVTHWWDGDHVASGWFDSAGLGVGSPSDFAWDVYLLFGPQSRWNGKPTALVSSGGTVASLREQLKRDLVSLL